ncbi:hypothetical protein DIPPA_03566 [Diplonema papillatum]|nr:hypothetical protein DIPPA_03566 [Diplonema papillatum]
MTLLRSWEATKSLARQASEEVQSLLADAKQPAAVDPECLGTTESGTASENDMACSEIMGKTAQNTWEATKDTAQKLQGAALDTWGAAVSTVSRASQGVQDAGLITWQAAKGGAHSAPDPLSPGDTWGAPPAAAHHHHHHGLQPDGGDAACSLSMPPSAEARCTQRGVPQPGPGASLRLSEN